MWQVCTGIGGHNSLPVDLFSSCLTGSQIFQATLAVVLFEQLCRTLVIPLTVACQAPLSVGFSRQKYWSG